MLEKEEWEAVEVNVHEILMGDVEDPDLMIAEPIYKWQQSEAGKYVMENSNPTAKWVRSNSPSYMGHKYTIKAYFTDKEVTYWKLKYE
tara:strand:- start:1024 stop:1287 length:264 start_codon:yes stop_codon:yes gene_type:complete